MKSPAVASQSGEICKDFKPGFPIRVNGKSEFFSRKTRDVNGSLSSANKERGGYFLQLHGTFQNSLPSDSGEWITQEGEAKIHSNKHGQYNDQLSTLLSLLPVYPITLILCEECLLLHVIPYCSFQMCAVLADFLSLY